MLLEIRCKEFKDEGRERKPIIFHEGLNTIMGASRASTLLERQLFFWSLILSLAAEIMSC